MRNMTAHGSLHLARKAEQVPQGLRDLGSSKRIFSLLFFENYQKNIDFLQKKIYYDDIKKISKRYQINSVSEKRERRGNVNTGGPVFAKSREERDYGRSKIYGRKEA